MATLSVTLGITSTDTTSENLAIGASDTLTVTNPTIDIARQSIATLGPGEFAFFPVKGAVGIEATANSAPCILEYGFWTKS